MCVRLQTHTHCVLDEQSPDNSLGQQLTVVCHKHSKHNNDSKAVWITMKHTRTHYKNVVSILPASESHPIQMAAAYIIYGEKKWAVAHCTP